jgi:hypothetical protein
MTIMDLSIHTTPLPHTDPEASLAFERVQASDAEVVQGPMEQYGGDRDCAFRDPAGNLVRIQELR